MEPWPDGQQKITKAFHLRIGRQQVREVARKDNPAHNDHDEHVCEREDDDGKDRLDESRFLEVDRTEQKDRLRQHVVQNHFESDPRGGKIPAVGAPEREFGDPGTNERSDEVGYRGTDDPEDRRQQQLAHELLQERTG